MSIPKGFCACGCGGRTRIATQTRADIGHVKGEHVAFINGHNSRLRTLPSATEKEFTAIAVNDGVLIVGPITAVVTGERRKR
jgi:hypothetical protein